MHTDRPKRAVVVVSRFNESVTRRLLDGALEVLGQRGYEDIDVYWVPGAFELPVMIHRALATSRYRIAVACGAVVRGETPHFDFIAAETTRGLGEAAIRFGAPVGYGLLTCDTMEQAVARAGGAAGNKGAEAAAAACDTLESLATLDENQE